MKKFLATLLFLLLGATVASAQPSPPPGPWVQSGNRIQPQNTASCITIPPTVTGGCQGVGTINATGLFINGTPVSNPGSAPRNTVFAGPPSGASAAPTFRSLIAADIPSLSGSYVTAWSGGTTGLTPSSGTSGPITLGGILTPTNGGTGVTSTSAIPVISTGSSTARTLAAHFADTFNAKDYGATGNGSTDDAASIQAAINAASPKGGTVVLPPGTYIVSTPLILNSYTSLSGAGPNATTIRANFTADAVIKSPDTTPITGVRSFLLGVQNLSIDNSNATKSGTIGINFSQSSQWAISDVVMGNVETGVRMDGYVFYGVGSNVRITPTTGGTGVQLRSGARENSLTAWSINGGAIGFDVEGTTTDAVDSIKCFGCAAESNENNFIGALVRGSSGGNIAESVEFFGYRCDAGGTGVVCLDFQDYVQDSSLISTYISITDGTRVGNAVNGTSAWAALTAYTAGVMANNGGNVYFVTSGGTSASSGGPSGRGSNITDGTVTWAYQGTVAATSNSNSGNRIIGGGADSDIFPRTQKLFVLTPGGSPFQMYALPNGTALFRNSVDSGYTSLWAGDINAFGSLIANVGSQHLNIGISGSNFNIAAGGVGNGDLQLSALGTGHINLISPLIYGGVSLSNSVTGTGPMVLGTNPALTTPSLGIATGTSLALGGAAIGSNALAITGAINVSGAGVFGGQINTSSLNVGGNSVFLNGAAAGDINSISTGRIGFAPSAAANVAPDTYGYRVAAGQYGFNGSISTAAPAGSSISAWKLGALQTGSVTLDTTRSVYVDIGGVVYHLMVSQ